jgi:phenylacetate-CoA ligase
VERHEGGSPASDPELAARIEKAVRKETLVSGKVEVVDYQSLPRTERKAKRVFDHRS